MSPTPPPLAATRTAIRRNAVWVVCAPTPAPRIARSAGNPTGSRPRAIAVTSSRGVPGVSSQPRPGRITSAQTSNDMARARARRPCSVSNRQRLVAARPAVGSAARRLALGVGARGQPAVLPTVAGQRLEPVQHRSTPRRRSVCRLADAAVNGSPSRQTVSSARGVRSAASRWRARAPGTGARVRVRSATNSGPAAGRAGSLIQAVHRRGADLFGLDHRAALRTRPSTTRAGSATGRSSRLADRPWWPWPTVVKGQHVGDHVLGRCGHIRLVVDSCAWPKTHCTSVSVM